MVKLVADPTPVYVQGAISDVARKLNNGKQREPI